MLEVRTQVTGAIDGCLQTVGWIAWNDDHERRVFIPRQDANFADWLDEADLVEVLRQLRASKGRPQKPIVLERYS